MSSVVEVEIVNKDENRENVQLTTKELPKKSLVLNAAGIFVQTCWSSWEATSDLFTSISP